MNKWVAKSKPSFSKILHISPLIDKITQPLYIAQQNFSKRNLFQLKTFHLPSLTKFCCGHFKGHWGRPKEDDGLKMGNSVWKKNLKYPIISLLITCVNLISSSKCSNWRRILKLLLSFGCLFTFCCLDGAKPIKTDSHICKLQVCNLFLILFAQIE